MQNHEIDHGKAFDWGRTSADYAKYRDIYPPEFYQALLDLGLCTKGQKVLDIGTGTGVLPRNLYPYGADFTGIDIAENQIIQATKLAEESNMVIRFICTAAEKVTFPRIPLILSRHANASLIFNMQSLPHIYTKF